MVATVLGGPSPNMKAGMRRAVLHTPPLHPWLTARRHSDPQGEMFRAQAVHDTNDPRGPGNVLRWVHWCSQPSICALSPLKNLPRWHQAPGSSPWLCRSLFFNSFALQMWMIPNAALRAVQTWMDEFVYLFSPNYERGLVLVQRGLNMPAPDSSRGINSGERVHFVT